jgi:hypothetical protein
MTRKEERLLRIRPHFPLLQLWHLLRLPGDIRPNWLVWSPFRRNDRVPLFIQKSSAMWLDHGDNTSGDSFALLCRLRGCDPDRPAAFA